MDEQHVFYSISIATELQQAAQWVLNNPRGKGSLVASIKAMRAETEPMVSLLVAKTVVMACFHSEG